MVQPHQAKSEGESDIPPSVSFSLVCLPHQVKVISLATSLAIGYRTHFAAILLAKSLSLSLWCG